MLSLSVIVFFLLLFALSRSGLIAAHWSDEVAPSYADPAWHLDPSAAATNNPVGIPNTQLGPAVDISDIDPIAPRYAELNERTAKNAHDRAEQATWLPFGADKWGHNVLTKTIKGAEVSITVGVLAALLALFIGTLLQEISTSRE